MGRMMITEFRKLTRLGRLPLIILTALALRAVLCLLPALHEHPYSVSVYKSYTAQLEGGLTDEKAEWLERRLAEAEELILSYDEMQQRYTEGMLSLEEYSDFTGRHGRAMAEESTLRYLCRKCELLKGCTEFDRQIFFDTAWSELFEDNGYDLVLLIALLCIAVPAFDAEFSSGSFAQLLTSKRGKTQLALSKLGAVWRSVFLLSLLISGVRFGVFAYQNGLGYAGLPAGNVLLTDSIGNTSLLSYYLRDAFIRALVWGMYSLLCCLIAVVCRSAAFSVILGFIACLTPQLIPLGEPGGAAAYLLSGLLLREMYPPHTSLALTAAVILLKGLLLSAAALLIWSRPRRSLTQPAG